MRQILLVSRSLWASDIFRMKDTEEMIYAFSQILRLNPQRVKEDFGKVCVHIASLSSDSEVPSQWECYASKGAGCAIGFDQAALDQWCQQHGLSLFPVSYSRHEEMFGRFKERVDHLLSNRGVMRWPQRAIIDQFSLAMTLKKEAYRAEREWRILVIQSRDEGRKQKHHLNSFTRPDGACCFALPICTPDLVTNVVMGPECSASPDELKRQLSDSGLSSVSIRHFHHCEQRADPSCDAEERSTA